MYSDSERHFRTLLIIILPGPHLSSFSAALCHLRCVLPKPLILSEWDSFETGMPAQSRLETHSVNHTWRDSGTARGDVPRVPQIHWNLREEHKKLNSELLLDRGF